MALSSERKAELAALELPSDADMARRALLFRQRSGLTMAEFSQAIGYAASSLHVFLGGHYSKALTEDHDHSRNTANIKARLKAFMDRWEGEQEDRSRPAFPTADLRRIVEACRRALENSSACVIDGPPGTQKSFSLRHAVREINAEQQGQAVYVSALPQQAPLGLLREIANRAGVPNRGDIGQVIRKLQTFLTEKRMLLVIDEAQDLTDKTLDVVRHLLDMPPYFGIVLAGADDLSRRLDSVRMERWRSRNRKTHRLSGPSREECREIIRAELGEVPDEKCDGLIERCMVRSYRTDHSDEGKGRRRWFDYISIRELYLTIEGIQQRRAGSATRPRRGKRAQHEDRTHQGRANQPAPAVHRRRPPRVHQDAG